jgi:hypothetical protein
LRKENISESKREYIESVEDIARVPLTDGAWNALTRLRSIDILELEVYIRLVREAAKAEE